MARGGSEDCLGDGAMCVDGRATVMSAAGGIVGSVSVRISEEGGKWDGHQPWVRADLAFPKARGVMTKDERPANEDWTADAYWKQPEFDPTETGDQNEAGIFTAVGGALSRWEQMEDALADMFDIFGTDEKQSITIHSLQMGRHMFGMIESSSTRLKMLQVAASLYFAPWWDHKPVCRPYLKLLGAISHASHRRNEIAHGRVTRVQVHRDGGPPKDSGAFLTSPRYAVNRNQPYYGGEWHSDDVLVVDRSKYRYRMSDIATFAQKFDLLGSKVRDLMMEASRGEHKMPNIVERLIKAGKLRANG
jgi:hypothetical protein